MDKMKIGISACLLGETVRYDGGHKLDRFLKETLGAFVTYVPVCPEVECGLGVPRESMRLVASADGVRLMTSRSGLDYTGRMLAWARGKVEEFEDVVGFICKSDSPSSGMERVKVYGAGPTPVRNGVGLFAGVFMERFPLIPVEDDGRLHDPGLRENFIERIFTLKRWREAMQNGHGAGAVVAFHTRNKLLILAHSTKHYQAMGRLVSEAGRREGMALQQSYERLLLEALCLKATPAKQVNVLQHMIGYFKKELSADEKQEFLDMLGQYRAGMLPLVVPVTLLRHYVRKYGQTYLKDQTYLNPHPAELCLRNHV